MLRMVCKTLAVLWLLVMPASAQNTNEVPNWAQNIWQGWGTLSQMADAEIEEIMDDPDRLHQHFGTASESLVQWVDDVRTGKVETRNPFKAGAGYAKRAITCNHAKKWMIENQEQLQNLWQFLREGDSRMTPLMSDMAGGIVAVASSPPFTFSAEKLAQYAKPELLGDYLTPEKQPACGLPKATTIVEVLETHPDDIRQIQAAVVSALSKAALTGDVKAVKLLGWLAGVWSPV